MWLRSKLGAVVPAVAAIGWTWAVALLSTREHLTAMYTVLSSAPPLWGFLVLGNAGLFALGAAGVLWALVGHRAAQRSGRLLPSSARWLLLAWFVPLADLARLTGWEIPYTFLEPILIAAVTGAAVRQLDSGQVFHPDSRRAGQAFQPAADRANARLGSPIRVRLESLTYRAVWLAAVWVLAVACAAWWYDQAQGAYDNYLLGYNDFGHFAWRVANTREGRGLLMETPGLPAFWDHFNPGLALLAPLWGLWPDAGLFFALQAVCLASPAPLLYGTVRRLGGTPSAAAAWAAAYLLFPAVGQLNLNCYYGWHPVSLALPLMFAAPAALARGWRVTAGVAAALACAFQEDVIAVLACLSLLLALAAWRNRKHDATAQPGVARLAGRLPWWGWIVVCGVLLTALAAVFALVPFARYQVGRFNRLGGSFSEVLFSPLLRPRVFWETVLRPRSLYFVLALWVPLGLRELWRGRVILCATLLPLGVLVAWGHAPATSIAFQYATALIPLFFLAAVVGAAATVASRRTASSGRSRRPEKAVPRPVIPVGAMPASQGGGALRSAGVAALAACAVASCWFGALPWSGATLTDVLYQTYGSDAGSGVIENREVGSPGNTMLNAIVQRVGGRQSSVLATGRIAAHLLRVRRLDTVAQAGERWQQFQAEIGPGRSPIELFDWIVLDTAENFYQSARQRGFIVDEARRANYVRVAAEHDVVVYARPSSATTTPARK